MKNHNYMLEILEQCIKLEKEKNLPETVMMFLGDGPLKEEIQQKATELGIASRILFMGNKKDVYRYYQAMDYFLLPSFYEGLPGTAVEAQASGLPGIISDAVTDEAVVTDLMQMRSVKEDALVWAKEIVWEYMTWTSQISNNVERKDAKNVSDFRCNERENYAQLVKKASFDVKEQARKMQEFYLTGEQHE